MDIFDTLAAEPKGDVFDEIAQSKGDIFDEVAGEAITKAQATEQPTERPDTWKDDWTGFVANMQIAGNRMLQGVSGQLLDSASRLQKDAQDARTAYEQYASEDINTPQSSIPNLGAGMSRKIALSGGDRRGYDQTKQELLGRAEQLEGLWQKTAKEIPEFASYIAEKEKRINELTPSLSPEMLKINNAKGAEFWKTFAKNPIEGLANIIASSAVVSAPAMVSGAVGSLAGPAGTALGAGMGSYSVETAQSMLDALKEAGVDLSNPEQVEAAFTDQAVMEKARDFANKRGIPVAIFDAASAGIAGKFVGPLLKEGVSTTTKEVIKASGKEVLTQTVPAGAGELTAQIASGEELSAKEIFMEAVGEIGSGVTEAAGNVIHANKVDAELKKTAAAEPPPPVTPPTEPFIPPSVPPTQSTPVTPPVAPTEPVPPVTEPPVEPAPTAEPTPEPVPESVPETPDGTQTFPSEKPERDWEFVGSTIVDKSGKPRLASTPVSGHLEIDMDMAMEGVNQPKEAQGFAFRRPDGEVVFVNRKDTAQWMIDTGRITGLKPGSDLITEHLRGLVEGVKYTENPPAKSKDDLVNEAANTFNPFFERAVSVAKAAGATDPESAVSDAMSELSTQYGEGKITLENPQALLMESSRRQALKQLEKETAQKRGGGKVVSSEVETVPEGKTDVGPRAEVVAKESAKSIQDVVDAMPENDRKVMTAFMQDHTLTNEEVAEDTGLTVDQVKKAKARAKKSLEEFIRSQSIGERMAPGASNIRELKIAQATLAATAFNEMQSEGTLTREAWENRMNEEYPDLFSQEDLQQLWELSNIAAQEFREKGGRKPMSKIIDQLTGAYAGEGTTGLRRSVTDKQREEMGLTPAKKEAKRSLPHVWDEAMKKIEDDPYLEATTLEKYRNSDEVPTDTEKAIILNAKIEAENRLAQAVDAYNKAETQEQKAVLQTEMANAMKHLQDVFDIAKSVGSASGRSLNAQKLMADRDFTLTRMLAETQASKGSPLTAEEVSEVQKNHDELNRSKAEMDDAVSQKEEEVAREQAQDTLDQMTNDVDPQVKSLLDRILDKLRKASDAAKERIRERLARTSTGLDPTILYDLSVIGAYQIAKGVKKLSDWKKAMSKELDGAFEEHYDEVFEQSSKRVDEAVDEGKPSPVKEKVKKLVKNPTLDQVIDDTQKKMRNRLKEGDSINDLRSYVQKLALALIRQGNTQLDPLLDTLHSMIAPMQEGITRREVMDLFSGYGHFTPLDKEKSKVIMREMQGESQQLAKIEDLETSGEVQKTGRERRSKSDRERRLTKVVNRLKKEKGVKTSDPETQLKTSLESTKDRVKNDIRDLTHQIETGENPVPGTPGPTDQEIENLKEIRSRLKDFLKAVEETPQGPSDAHIKAYEKEIKAIESAINTSIKSYEAQLKGEKKTPRKKDFTNAKIESLKATRDALKSSVEEMKAADEDLRNTREFDRLNREAAKLQDRLARGDVSPGTKAARIEDALVKEARDALTKLREQMQAAKEATPEFQQAKLDAAIKAVEKSIKAYDERLKTGAKPTPGTPKVTSPVLERLKAERDAMIKLVKELEKGPRPSRNEVALKSYKTRLKNKIADMAKRAAVEDFTPREKHELDLSKDKEAIKLRMEYEEALRDFNKRKREFELKNETTKDMLKRKTKETLGAFRSVRSAFDLSMLMMQGGQQLIAHPIRSVAAMKDMARSFSEKGYNAHEAELKSRPNYLNGTYQKYKLALTSMNDEMTKREENYQSNLAHKIPGVKISERLFTSFMNRLRADAFDALLEAQPLANPIQKKALAHFVNAATGRGDLGGLEKYAEAASTVLWSPRLLASRIQMLTAEPLLRGDAKGVRGAIAKEYARTIGGIGVILALGAMAGGDIEDDPKSSDFAKLRFGKTRFDPWLGMQPLMTLLFRSNPFGPKATTTKGRTYSLRAGDKDRTKIDPTWADLIGRFVRGKATPLLGAGLNVMSGEDVVGKPVRTPLQIAGQFSPLSVTGMEDLIKEYGVPKGVALWLATVAGAKIQVYDD